MYADLQTRQNALTLIELAFDEPSDFGLSKLINRFLAAFDDVANHPDDPGPRHQLVDQGNTLLAGFTQLDTALAAQQSSSLAVLAAQVDDVNSTAAHLADLNRSIRSALADGFSANELMDERALLIGRLAEQIGVTAVPRGSGDVDVFVGGTAIVRGSQVSALRVEITGDPNQTAQVTWAAGGYAASVTGSIGGLMAVTNDIVPRCRTGLSGVMQQLSAQVNVMHRAGYALDGSTGRDFFTRDAEGRLQVNPAITGDADLVAASAVPDARRDGSIAQRIADLAGVGDGYIRLVVNLAVESQAVNRRLDLQTVMVRHIDGARESAAGVNLDEEVTAMLQYQHAYKAAARFLTAIDELLETLINHTGMVGRW